MLCTYPANRDCSTFTGRQRPASHVYRIYKQRILPDVQIKTSARFPLSTNSNLKVKTQLVGIVLISHGRRTVWMWRGRLRAGEPACGLAFLGLVLDDILAPRPSHPCGISDPFCLPLDGAALAGRWCVTSLWRRALNTPSAQAPSKMLPFLIQIPFLIG